MEHKLIKDIFLLSLYITKSNKIYTSTSMMSYSLIGAVLYEMLEKELISFKENEVILNEAKVNEELDSLFLPFVTVIKKNRSKRIKYLTSRMLNASIKLKKPLLLDLEKRGIIQKIGKKFLGFIPYSYRIMVNRTYLDMLLNDIHATLYADKKLNFYYASIFSLIKASKLEKKLSKEKQQQKEIKALLAKKETDTEVSKEIKKAFDEMQAAMTTMIITSSVAATSVSR